MGKQAEHILDGDDCEVCGMYIGDGDGFPRKCDGCQSDEDKPSAGTYSHRSARKASANKEAQDKIKKKLVKWCAKMNAEFKIIQPWHFSMERMGNRIDIFPNTKKFHHVTKNVRGRYHTIEEFLSQFEKRK